MQENKFEKQVQEQMAELHLRPSAAVWEKVEEELRKKKRRRVLVLLFLLAGLSLLGYTGFTLFNRTASPLAKTAPATDPSVGLHESYKDIPDTTGRPVSTKPAQQIGSANENSQISQALIFNNEKNKSQPIGLPPSQKRELWQRNQEEEKSAAVLKLEDKQEITTQEKEELPVITGFPPTIIDHAGLEKALENEQGRTGISSNPGQRQEPELPANAKTPGIGKTDSAIAETKLQTPVSQKKQSHGINWGLDFFAGLSDRQSTAFPKMDFGMQRRENAMSNNGVSGSGPFGPSPLTLPSAVDAGPAFSIGITGEKKLGSKSSISAGLRYAYQSDRIKIGTYRDTSFGFANLASQLVTVRAVYRGSQMEIYTNRYHFIQVPIRYQLQVNKSHKLPVSWHIGGSLGYLLATNGLMYDTTLRGIYYKDRKAFTRFHLSLTTGFAFQFGREDKLHWSVGPEFSIGLNKLAKDAYDKKQYLFYGGISGRIMLPKRKK